MKLAHLFIKSVNFTLQRLDFVVSLFDSADGTSGLFKAQNVFLELTNCIYDQLALVWEFLTQHPGAIAMA